MKNKRKRHRSLRHQFGFIMQNATDFGASKRSYRKQTGKQKTNKIFSYSNYDAIKETAESLAKYIKDKYPEIKYIKDIKKEHITEFLEYKALTCNDTTLVKIHSHIMSLALFAGDAYKIKIDWNVQKVKSKKQYQYTKKGRAMSKETFEEIERYLENCNRYTESNTLMLLRFARSTGLRVDEIAHQRIDAIYLEGGEFGLGYIDVSCGKHGRKRIIDIKSAEDRKVIEEVIENARREGIDYVTTKKTATLENRLTNVKKKVGINEELVGWHGIRKLYAQEYYDQVRKETNRRDAIGKTNQQLGHGYDRGEQALRTYVGNMW